MNTTTINPSEKSESNKKKNATAFAATAATAAAVGVVGAKVASMYGEDSEAGAEEPILQSGDADTSAPDVINQTQQPASSSTTASTGVTDNVVNAEAVDPLVEDPLVEEPLVEEPLVEEPLVEDPLVEEPLVEEPLVEDPLMEAPLVDEPLMAGEPSVEDPLIEGVNPDEIAEAIIAETQIDPNDIDMNNVLVFDELGAVYTVNGESYTAATFSDNNGNQMMMVDIDGDSSFDIITDANGNPITDEYGFVADAGNLTVDDVEMAISGGCEYLASDDSDVQDYGSDTIFDDMIS